MNDFIKAQLSKKKKLTGFYVNRNIHHSIHKHSQRKLSALQRDCIVTNVFLTVSIFQHPLKPNYADRPLSDLLDLPL